MYFQDRYDAGVQLAKLLRKYQGEEVIVYGLPRGGVVVASPIADALSAPLDLVLAHKVGHPYQPEYAIAAVSESGHMIGNPHELASFDAKWLEKAKVHEMQEIERRRKIYLKGRPAIPVKNKVAIIVDDGIATGLTMQAGIAELKDKKPKMIVAAVPVAPKKTAALIGTLVDDFVAVICVDEYEFLGAVGSYYKRFDQTQDQEVIVLLDKSSRTAK